MQPAPHPGQAFAARSWFSALQRLPSSSERKELVLIACSVSFQFPYALAAACLASGQAFIVGVPDVDAVASNAPCFASFVLEFDGLAEALLKENDALEDESSKSSVFSIRPAVSALSVNLSRNFLKPPPKGKAARVVKEKKTTGEVDEEEQEDEDGVAEEEVEQESASDASRACVHPLISAHFL